MDLLSAAGNPTMAAHVHTDLAMLALEGRDARTAAEHASSAVMAARAGGPRSGEARALALLARAHGAAGELVGCRAALDRARDALTRAQPGDESWVAFFTADQWATEAVYALAGVAAVAELESLSAPVLARSDRMHRRRLLLSTTLAASYCLAGRGVERDLERATELVVTAVADTGRIGSARSLARIDVVRQSVRAEGKHTLARQLDDAVAAALSA